MPSKLGEQTLVAGVTVANYSALGRAFMGSNGGTGFLIATENGAWQGVKYSQTLKQWGAWLAFFKSIKLPHAFMLQREFYTVPAEWPHLFTSDATVQVDHAIGEEFERRYLGRKAEERERYVRKPGVKSFPRDQRRQPTPSKHLKPDPFEGSLDREALYRSHDEAVKV